LARVLPGHHLDYYLGRLPYAQGLQLQSIDLARNGVKFNTPKQSDKSFDDIAGK
tara:strand:- start:2906 stop:3067 length:162 start_codon:yes stop_codon:yes gene_type:complete